MVYFEYKVYFCDYYYGQSKGIFMWLILNIRYIHVVIIMVRVKVYLCGLFLSAHCVFLYVNMCMFVKVYLCGFFLSAHYVFLYVNMRMFV